jgi:hypothetical protein
MDYIYFVTAAYESGQGNAEVYLAKPIESIEQIRHIEDLLCAKWHLPMVNLTWYQLLRVVDHAKE